MRSKRYAIRFRLVSIERCWTVSQSIDPIVTLSIMDMTFPRNWKLAKACNHTESRVFSGSINASLLLSCKESKYDLINEDTTVMGLPCVVVLGNELAVLY